MGKIKTWISAILKIAVTLLVISPFYIAVVYSVKSKPELVTNRLAWPKEIHWENFTNAIETSNFGLALKNSFYNSNFGSCNYHYLYNGCLYDCKKE